MPGTIVVGVDGSAGSDAALRWALGEARVRGSALRVVHVYQPPQVPRPDTALAFGGMAVPAVVTEDAERLRRKVEGEARRLIEGAVQRAEADTGDGVVIERVAIGGSPAPALIEAARGAELLVVGSRAHGGLVSMLLGSVTDECAHHPPCPVVIMPPPDRR
jgi:nucleotide-binding universal stress UspA family protein